MHGKVPERHSAATISWKGSLCSAFVGYQHDSSDVLFYEMHANQGMFEYQERI